MRVLIINETANGSTGKICRQIAKNYIDGGDECVLAIGRGEIPQNPECQIKWIGNKFGLYSSVLMTRLFDTHGLNSKIATKKFLKWADSYNPDIVWLHNIHGYYINYEMLFDWIKKRPNMKVKWTLHDCWAFTGHCSYFTMAKCNKWQFGCKNCPQKKEYPKAVVIDNSYNNYNKKKKAFLGVRDMTVIAVSHWLENLIKKSFLKDYNIEVEYNKVNTDIFKPTESDFKEKYNIKGKKVVLSVANVWPARKGLADLTELSKLLDESYKIVLVGLSDAQIASLPENVIGLKKTDCIEDLVKIYSAADILVSASKEETFGMTILEAYHCGTPSVVYKDTACEEVAQMTGGIAVEQSPKAIFEAIQRIYK